MEGKYDKAMGGMKQTIGNAVGSERMQADGAAQAAKGDAKSAAQNLGQKGQQTYNNAKDSMNSRSNNWTGDRNNMSSGTKEDEDDFGVC